MGAQADVGQGPALEGHKVVPYCPRCGTALSSHEVALGYKDVEDPSVYVPFPVTAARGGAGGRRRAAGLDHDAVDARLQRRAGRRSRARPTCAPAPADGHCRAGRGAGRSACWARAPRTSTASRARRWSASRYEPPFAFIAGTEYGPKGHTVLPGRLRHHRGRHRHRPHRDRLRRGRLPPRRGERPRRSSTRSRPDGTFDERIGPYAGRYVKEADADMIEELRARGRLLRAERLRARLPALLALRHAAALLRQAVLVHPHDRSCGPAARGQRDRRLASGAHQARALRRLAGEQRRLGALARALLGHAAAGLALRERPRPLRRLASPSSRSWPACGSRTCTAPTWTTSTFDCANCGGRWPRARGDRRLVRLGLRCPSPSTTRRSRTRSASTSASRPTTSARRSTRRAAGSTRCSPSRRCSTTARSYRDRPVPRPDPRSRGPEDVQVAGNIVDPWEVLDTTARTRSAGTSSPPSSPGTATASRVETVGESVRQFLKPLWNTYGFYAVRQRTTSSGAEAVEPTDLDRWALRAWPRRSRQVTSAWTTTTPPTPGGRSRPTSTSCPTGTCAARAGASGTATPPPSPRCATCLRGRGEAAGPFTPFVADGSTRTSTAPSPRVHLCDYPERGARPRDERARGGMAVARETVRLGLARAARSKLKVRQPLREAVVVAAGREREAIERFERHRARGAQRARRCATRATPTSSANYESSRTTARSARASASTCRRWPRRSRPGPGARRRRRCARGGERAA